MSTYRGYKSRRAYLNAKCNGLSVKAGGDKTLLKEGVRNLLSKRVPPVTPPASASITLLTDKEAEELFKELTEKASIINANMKEVNKLTNNDIRITQGQINAIYSAGKYKLRWKDDALMSYILGMFPDKRKKLLTWEIEQSKLSKLMNILTKAEADLIIKRLDKIQEGNKDV